MSVKMNPDAKEKIVSALRSGEYKQGRGSLHEDGCFCVWGVICDASGLDEWVPTHSAGVMRYGEDGDICFPRLPVMNWAGITTSSEVNVGDIRADLMNLNDMGITFEQLATAIEEQL